MSWAEYRKRSDNVVTIPLTDEGLTDFHVLLRRMGSYTMAELSQLQTKWLDERVKYLTQKVVHLAENTEINLSEYQQEVDDVINELEGGVAIQPRKRRGADAQFEEARRVERRNKIADHLLQENSISRWQAITGMDIEMLVGWNLTDPETSVTLPLPRDDMSVFERIPLDVLWHIKEKIIDLVGEAAPPKVRQLLSIPS